MGRILIRMILTCVGGWRCVKAVWLNHQVRGTEGDSRGLLWVLDEEMLTHGSTENTVLERVCQHFSGTGAVLKRVCFFGMFFSHLKVFSCLFVQSVSVNSLFIVRSLM